MEVNSVTEAIPRAEAALRTLVSDHDFRLRTESTQEKNFGWVFFYAPQRYLETGDRKYLVPGTAPLIVLRDGRVEWLPSSLPPAAAIERFEAQWTERQRE